MKFSDETFDNLKMLSSVCPSIWFTEGNQLVVNSESKQVIGVCDIPDEIEQDFGVYDIGEFLSTIDIYGPNMNLGDKSLEVYDDTGRRRSTYYYCAKEVISLIPESVISKMTTDYKNKEPMNINFKLAKEDLQAVKRSATMWGYKNVCLSVIDNVLSIQAVDETHGSEENGADSTAPVGTIALSGDFDTDNFKMYIKTDALNRLYETDYDVSINEKRIWRFAMPQRDVYYFVLGNSNSTYN